MGLPYNTPAFLENQSVDEIHGRMMATLPDDIEKSELSIPWDMTRPSAIEKAQLVEFTLNETIKLIFPQWSYAEWIDLHAEKEGLERRAANKATGEITVTGMPGTFLPDGFQFATPSTITESVLFEILDDVVLEGVQDDAGDVTMTLPIQAVYGGISGNVQPDTIVLMARPNRNITRITNEAAVTGGTVEESDNELIDRIIDSLRLGQSYTGCDDDYVRWAREVPGVGQAVVDPEWDDPELDERFEWWDSGGNRRKAGAVRLFVVDANGLPANPQIIDAVYDHIISPENRGERLAPIGAKLTVATPHAIPITISANIRLREDESLAVVIDRFRLSLNAYWLVAASENDVYDVQSGLAFNMIRYVMIGAILAKTPGIANYDHESLLVNGEKYDIPLKIGEYPVTTGVLLNE